MHEVKIEMAIAFDVSWLKWSQAQESERETHDHPSVSCGWDTPRWEPLK